MPSSRPLPFWSRKLSILPSRFRSPAEPPAHLAKCRYHCPDLCSRAHDRISVQNNCGSGISSVAKTIPDRQTDQHTIVTHRTSEVLPRRISQTIVITIDIQIVANAIAITVQRPFNKVRHAIIISVRSPSGPGMPSLSDCKVPSKRSSMPSPSCICVKIIRYIILVSIMSPSGYRSGHRRRHQCQIVGYAITVNVFSTFFAVINSSLSEESLSKPDLVYHHRQHHKNAFPCARLKFPSPSASLSSKPGLCGQHTIIIW